MKALDKLFPKVCEALDKLWKVSEIIGQALGKFVKALDKLSEALDKLWESL